MKRFTTAAAALLIAAGLHTMLSAQGERGASSTVTVSGCIAQAERTGSLADDSGAGIAATPNTAPIEANTAEPVDAYLLTNATRLAAAADEHKPATPTSYTLQGREQELAKHKGHRVEISGQLLPPRAAAASTKAPAPGIERIAVASIKMLSADCPAKPPAR